MPNWASTSRRRLALDDLSTPARPVPARIEAEDFANKYGIQFETTTDTGGGLNAGYSSVGDWIEYLLETPTAGLYSIDLRGASQSGVAKVRISAEEEAFTSAFFPATGGWQTWTTERIGEIVLPNGEVTLRLTIDSPSKEDLNINWLDIKLVEAYENPDDYGMFNGFEVVDGWVDTGDFVGWVNITHYPYVYLLSMEAYGYAAPSDSGDGWLYIPN